MSVVTERFDSTLVVTIDRYEKRNAIDRNTSEQIESALNELEDDSSLRAGVITGTGGVFCAGSDLKAEIGSNYMPRGGEYGVIRRRRTKPLIAAVEGVAFGGGFEIALACDLIVASREARFALPEATRGTLAASGGMFRAQRALPRNVANELLLTGEALSAERAYAFGFVNELCEPGKALSAAVEFARRIRKASPASIRATLAVRDQVWEHVEAVGWNATEEHLESVRRGPEMAEGIAAFFERRPPHWAD
ncbi:enoyl-CoA hydratase-related protein [Leucobacter denitrificans]|uniref:Enoyl-CoA hydratase/isomerase family protein n=1 Tax=Leucobacter denitrificans TaxID=683042 RepID=A0A7G9S2A2_9MICO|nr:enoyl-CoA hydratase-related protein [Leucobacter denitrificans]QNN61977.1 enoyl-CoA hydratase/isomerase family protein [Leucobacter denitrificans]